MNNLAVETKGLTKTYRTTNAVSNVDINVPAGACCGFLGKNGAGKTTTIKMLVGLIPATSGSITLMGQTQTFGQQCSSVFGYLPDVPNYYGYMTADEFLTLCANICKIPPNEKQKRVKELLKLVGLDRTRTRITGYSRGMKQRLGIAQAMINNPKIIFMDEPMSALDPMGRRDVAEIISSLKGTTVIFSTHILADIESVCDYILIIEKGKIVAQDTMLNLKKRHSENTAKLRLYNEGEAAAFLQQAENAGLSIERGEHQEFLLHAENGQELSRKVMQIAAGGNFAVESFAAHSPSLEEIFYREIAPHETRGKAASL